MCLILFYYYSCDCPHLQHFYLWHLSKKAICACKAHFLFAQLRNILHFLMHLKQALKILASSKLRRQIINCQRCKKETFRKRHSGEHFAIPEQRRQTETLELFCYYKIALYPCNFGWDSKSRPLPNCSGWKYSFLYLHWQDWRLTYQF